MKRKKILQVAAVVLIAISGHTQARSLFADRPTQPHAALAAPQYVTTEHNIGDMALGVTNSCAFGSGYAHTGIDCFTGQAVKSCEFPIGSGTLYLFAGTIWVGGIRGSDTLVSTGFDGWFSAAEMNPDESPNGSFRYRSTIAHDPIYRVGAKSHQDFVATYWDTCTTCPGLGTDDVDHRQHKPLFLRFDQSTYAWHYPLAEDIVFFDIKITNVGTSTIDSASVGIYVDGDVRSISHGGSFTDDISGFIGAVTDSSGTCPFTRQIPVAWIADDDGDLSSTGKVPNVTATALLNVPIEPATVSFNWWISNSDPAYDFGPRRKSNIRDFGTGGTGTPLGDRNKYWMLSNGDVDYDQVFTATISPEDSVWEYPPMEVGMLWDNNSDTRYLLSIGSFDLAPGQSFPLTFAYLGGKNLHRYASNIHNLPLNPTAYEANLDFSDLKRNSLWASWIYDNPGVDTDSDGYAGQFVVCGSDTTWIAGDGVPDFRASEPPPRPRAWATPTAGGIQIRWNGFASESSRDPFSRTLDFEGYNVHLQQAGTPGWQKITGYDREDYYRMIWSLSALDWKIEPSPKSIEELRCSYATGGCNDSTWLPMNYSRSEPFVKRGPVDSIFYFISIGCNASVFGHGTSVQKTYPTAPKPHFAKPSDVPIDSAAVYLTPDGYFKYYEYQCAIPNLLPGETYDVSVTAFDFGPAFVGAFYPLESPVDAGALTVVPLVSTNCCVGVTGNIDCDATGDVDIADLTALIDYLYITMNPPCCMAAANVDGSPDGNIDISDLTALIDYQYIRFTPLSTCQ